MDPISQLDQKYGLSGGGNGQPTPTPTPAPQQGIVQRLINSNTIPRGESAVAGTIGRFGGPLASTGLAGAGYAKGYTEQEQIRQVLQHFGMQGLDAAPSGQDYMHHLLGGSGEALKNAGMINTGLEALQFLLHPLNGLGSFREKLLGDTNRPTADMETAVKTNMENSPAFKMAPAESQIAGRSRLLSYLNNLNPLQSTGGVDQPESIQQNPNTRLNDMYKNLNSFEQSNKPFTKGGDMPSVATGQGANLADRAIRDYLTSQIGTPGRIINTLLSKGYQIENSPVARWIPRLGLGLAAYRGVPALLKKLQGGQ